MISQTGKLDPLMTEGKRAVVWLVEGNAVGWALDHVSRRRNVLSVDLFVCEVHVQRDWIRRHGDSCMWFSARCLDVFCAYSYQVYYAKLSESVLNFDSMMAYRQLGVLHEP